MTPIDGDVASSSTENWLIGAASLLQVRHRRDARYRHFGAPPKLWLRTARYRARVVAEHVYSRDTGIGEDYSHTAARVRPTLEGLRDSDWDRPTPCEGWTVRDVANHVASNPMFLAAVASGATLHESCAVASVPEDIPLVIAMAKGDDDARRVVYRPRDWIGELGNVGALLDQGLEALSRCMEQPGVLDRVVEAGIGTMPFQFVLMANTGEWVTHGIDLCHALNAPIPFDDDFLTLRCEEIKTLLPPEGSQFFGPRAEEPSQPVDPAKRLAWLTGRAI